MQLTANFKSGDFFFQQISSQEMEYDEIQLVLLLSFTISVLLLITMITYLENDLL